MKIDNLIGISDDYAILDAGVYRFYYGYESTYCKIHGNDSSCGCYDNEWCFVVQKSKKEVYRLSRSNIESENLDTYEMLLKGIQYFGNIYWKD